MSWLDDLKAGDSIIYGSQVLKVLRTTRTQILVKIGMSETRFWKEDGARIGMDQWTIVPHQIRQATPEAVSKISESRKRSELMNIKAHLAGYKPSDAQVLRIYDILSEPEDAN